MTHVKYREYSTMKENASSRVNESLLLAKYVRIAVRTLSIRTCARET
jgi:hypothetical protein